MRAAVLGRGAREHAIAWRLTQDLGATNVRIFPGGDGIPGSVPVDPGDDEALVAALRREGSELVVIGPEAMLERGLADHLRARGFLVVGPGVEGARLESSKAFAKAFMGAHGVRTARAVAVRGDEADRALSGFQQGAVLKYDGLAQGKGVIVCGGEGEARLALAELRGRYGEDATFVIEERLRGPELSLIAMVGGERALLLPEARDHKRLLDGDLGPNTGGMGAFSPVPDLTAAQRQAVLDDIVAPTLRGLGSDIPGYRGFLYFGIMLTPQGPHLLEYNARMGDPEAQVVLPRIAGSFAELCVRCASGDIASGEAEVTPDHAVAVVIAAEGYPGPLAGEAPELGDLSRASEDALVFHAGTRRRGERFVATGGRALSVVGRGSTHAEATRRAYQAVERSGAGARGLVFRRDVGQEAAP